MVIENDLVNENMSAIRKPVPSKMAKLLPPPVWDVFRRFTEKGYEIYLVGGGVRKLLLGKVPDNCDFTTNAQPEIIQAFFEKSFYDNKFGTVGIPVEIDGREEIYEITTYRSEKGYSDRRRPDKVSWETELEKDLERREFTVSAMVIGPLRQAQGKLQKWDGKTLELIDLFGGLEDFENKIIRAVGEPENRFQEDALRMMRVIRLAAQYGFQIEAKTFSAIRQNAGLINKISAERIRDELFKILASPYPADGYQLLRDAGLAEIILPKAEAMFGVDQKSPGRHHQDDVGTHAMKSLAASKSKDSIVNLAILLHDVGKPPTAGRDEKGTITFYNHEVVGAAIARRIGQKLRLSRRDQERLWLLVRYHQFTVDERQTDKAIRRFIRHVGKENIADMLEVRRADRIGGGARETSWRLERFKKKLVEVQKQPFSIRDLKISGHDVMKELGISPGPEIGRILTALFEEVEEDIKKNEREYLLGRIREIRKKNIATPGE